MDDRRPALALYSPLAFYPVHWRALLEVVRITEAKATVLAGRPSTLPAVHVAHGVADPETEGLPIEVRRMPDGSRATRVAWLAREVRALDVDAIWIQAEPIDPFALEILAVHRFRRSPRIVTAVCENIFPRPVRLAERTARRILWPRFDHLMTVARPSLEGVRAGGMPASVASSTLVVGGLEPEAGVTPMAAPVSGPGFTVGFAGRLVEEKGWRILLEALDELPDEVRLVVAGDGPQRAELEERIATESRAHYAGLLPKDELWSFYAALDCLAVPSLTTPRWKEQSASTLVDGLAMGLPLVASDSGGIPDIMGRAGLLVREGDARALADALLRIRDDPGLRAGLSAAARRRFHEEFSIPAYARKIATALDLPLA